MEQPRSPKKRVTYSDYLTWDDTQRWEVIDGESYLMAPAPATRHQRLVTSICITLSQHLKGTPCEVFVAPLDVKLSEKDVVQPDVLVVCNPEQLKETHLEGPPTLVVEVLSPSSVRHDRIRKLSLYAKYSVQEYWLVNPDPAMLEVLSLGSKGSYEVAGVYAETDTVQSPTLKLNIPGEAIFGEPQEYPGEVREATPP